MGGVVRSREIGSELHQLTVLIEELHEALDAFTGELRSDLVGKLSRFAQILDDLDSCIAPTRRRLPIVRRLLEVLGSRSSATTQGLEAKSVCDQAVEQLNAFDEVLSLVEEPLDRMRIHRELLRLRGGCDKLESIIGRLELGTNAGARERQSTYLFERRGQRPLGSGTKVWIQTLKVNDGRRAQLFALDSSAMIIGSASLPDKWRESEVLEVVFTGISEAELASVEMQLSS
jgi:hypothetical protein